MFTKIVIAQGMILQNTIKDYMEIALEMYGIPIDAWVETDCIRAGF